MAKEVYIHNSKHKEYVRDKWVEFAKETIQDNPLNIITFPAEEMHELHLFAEHGLIQWRETESGAYEVDNKICKIVCFEKSAKIYMNLHKKLVGATVLCDEIGSYFRSKYQAIMNRDTKVFPVDVINLDYDGNISKSNVPINEIINLIFQYQSLHKKNFSLFITWPSTEAEDEKRYKDLLKNTIEDNLEDPRATSFKEKFDQCFESINDLSYHDMSIIGLSKIIIKNSSDFHYELHRNEFFIYGEEKKKQMYSVLFNFTHTPENTKIRLYKQDVSKSLNDINNLQENT